MNKHICPNCKKEAQWEDNPFRPFCSQRCKLIDLGNWASGRYAIAGDPVNEDELPLEQTQAEDQDDQ